MLTHGRLGFLAELQCLQLICTCLTSDWVSFSITRDGGSPWQDWGAQWDSVWEHWE